MMQTSLIRAQFFFFFSAVTNKNKSPRIHGKLSKCSYHPLSLFYLSIYYCISPFPSSFLDQLRLFVVKGESCLLLSCSFSSQNETLLLNSKYVFSQTVIPTCWCYFCTSFDDNASLQLLISTPHFLATLLTHSRNVSAIITAKLTLKALHFPDISYFCLIWFSQRAAVISANSINHWPL